LIGCVGGSGWFRESFGVLAGGGLEGGLAAFEDDVVDAVVEVCWAEVADPGVVVDLVVQVKNLRHQARAWLIESNLAG